MARTGGELLPSSFDAVFTADALVRGGGADASQASMAADAKNAPHALPVRVFVDIGSGHGQIVRAAVEGGAFDRGIGIEKYK